MEEFGQAVIACFGSLNDTVGLQDPYAANGTSLGASGYNYSNGWPSDGIGAVSAGTAEERRLQCEALLKEYRLLTLGPRGDDQYTRDTIAYYLMGLGGMTLCCLGLVGNMVSLLVLSQKNMRSSTYSYLSALAVCDSLFLLCTIILLVKDVNQPSQDASSAFQQVRWPYNEGAYPYLFPYVHPLAFMFQVTSIWLTLSFTVDRYIMICHPFQAEPFCTISRARKVVASLFLGSFLFNLPKFFEYKTVAIPLPDNTTRIGCDLSAFGRSHIFRELYHSWLYVVFVCGVPFLVLAVLNSFLINAVRLSRKRGREINAAERKKNDTTVMLIGVVITFFICQMPALVSRLLWALEDNPDAFKHLPLYTLNEIASFLIVVNSASNIIPYYFFGARFRKNFWRLFCSCLLRYAAFKKLTRSFSLTVLDNERRTSAQSNVLPRHSNASHYGNNTQYTTTTTPSVSPSHPGGNSDRTKADPSHLSPYSANSSYAPPHHNNTCAPTGNHGNSGSLCLVVFKDSGETEPGGGGGQKTCGDGTMTTVAPGNHVTPSVPPPPAYSSAPHQRYSPSEDSRLTRTLLDSQDVT